MYYINTLCIVLVKFIYGCYVNFKVRRTNVIIPCEIKSPALIEYINATFGGITHYHLRMVKFHIWLYDHGFVDANPLLTLHLELLSKFPDRCHGLDRWIIAYTPEIRSSLDSDELATLIHLNEAEIAIQAYGPFDRYWFSKRATKSGIPYNTYLMQLAYEYVSKEEGVVNTVHALVQLEHMIYLYNTNQTTRREYCSNIRKCIYYLCNLHNVRYDSIVKDRAIIR